MPETVGIIADTHLPFEHPDYLPWVVDTFAAWGVTRVVHAGDLMDSHALSRHDPDPDGDSISGELDRALARLEQWGAAFPVVTVMIGNHDKRYLRIAYERGIPRRMLCSLSESYQTPPGWTWVDSVTIDDVLYTHGDGMGGQYAYRHASERMGCNVVIGHIHSYPGIAATRKAGCGLRWGMCVGCAIDETAYAMAYGRHLHPRPVLGCGIVRGGVPHYIPMGDQP